MLLAAGHVDAALADLLSQMCHEMVDAVSVVFLEEVRPQVLNWITLKGPSSSADTHFTR